VFYIIFIHYNLIEELSGKAYTYVYVCISDSMDKHMSILGLLTRQSSQLDPHLYVSANGGKGKPFSSCASAGGAHNTKHGSSWMDYSQDSSNAGKLKITTQMPEDLSKVEYLSCDPIPQKPS
jgi:hypothetical protein